MSVSMLGYISLSACLSACLFGDVGLKSAVVKIKKFMNALYILRRSLVPTNPSAQKKSF